MADNPLPSNGDAAPSVIVDEQDVEQQLIESRRIREEATATTERADVAIGEMSRILRRIAGAIERNPQSWDDLFDGKSR